MAREKEEDRDPREKREEGESIDDKPLVPLERPEQLDGKTYKIKWPESDHAIYITMNMLVPQFAHGEAYLNVRILVLHVGGAGGVGSWSSSAAAEIEAMTPALEGQEPEGVGNKGAVAPRKPNSERTKEI